VSLEASVRGMEESLRAEVDRQVEEIRAGAERIYGESDLRARLAEAIRNGRPMRVKLGVDPSAPDLHLGHTVVINKLRRFQALGHLPIFLVGDFTARIGDPSGRKKTRPALDAAEVRRNAETYLEQVRRVLDVERAEIRFNSEWMEPMSSSDLVRLCSHYTVARLLERDDFAKRMKAEEPIAVHEFLYPFVQAYDSVALRADVEIGGTDQTFNLLMAREVQRAYGQPPQSVVVHPLLVGTDGRDKMSKSLGNTIGITEPPSNMFGKIMSIPDTMMETYVDLLIWAGTEERAALLTGVRDAIERRRDPMDFKLDLAGRLVAQYHGIQASTEAREAFRREVQRREVPAELAERIEEVGSEGSIELPALLERLGLAPSRSEARRLMAQGAVQVNGQRVGDPGHRLGRGGYTLRAGKRRFARVRLV